MNLLFQISLLLFLGVCVENINFKGLSRIYSSSNFYKTQIPANYSVKWYLQEVDHFSYVNQDRFKQRYIISTDNWCEGCPIFLYVGGEGDILHATNNTDLLWENSKQFKAMVLFAEHRYYGESIPYGKQTRNLTHLGYLTTEQALADLATLLDHIKETIPKAKKSPVVVFGGSYAGMLATWFRIKYPHLTVGALASSAPILHFPGIYECNQYYDIVTNDFKQYSEKCVQSIRNSWAAIRRVGNTDNGLKWLSDTFVLCKQLKINQLDTLMSWLSSTWESLAMADFPNPASLMGHLPAYPVRETCKHLTDPHKSDKQLIVDIFSAVSVFYNYTGQTKCNYIDVEHQYGNLATYTWMFQQCTEMVMPLCSNGKSDMFEENPWNLTQFSESCYKSFGVKSDGEKAIVMFGGKNILTSNIIFSNGMRDPLSAGGVLQSLSQSLIAINISNGCHHEDLRYSGDNDPPALRAARMQEMAIIKHWINDYYKQINFYPKQWKIND